MTKIKPAPWAVNPVQVAPEWWGAWDELKILHTLMGDLQDMAGNNPGTMGATPPTWSASSIGRVLTFDGSDDFYTVADSPALSLPDGDWTLVWYQHTPDITGSPFQMWHSWGGYGATPSIQSYIYEASGQPGRWEVDIRDDSGSNQRLNTDSGLFPTNRFRLFAVQRIGTGAQNIHLSVDGIEVTANYALSTEIDDSLNRSDALSIGKIAGGEADRLWAGNMSWWGKWNRALSVGDMQQLSRDPFGSFRFARSLPLPLEYQQVVRR